MITVQLPFPPLPIMALKGDKEESQESVCSSHDLLGRAISCTLVNPPNTCVLADRSKKKIQVLTDLNTAVSTAVRRHMYSSGLQIDEACTCDCVIDAVYDAYCSSLRSYMSFYEHDCADVRFMPHNTVCTKSLLIKQGKEHLLAMNASMEPSEQCSRKKITEICTYKHLLSQYAFSMTELVAQQSV